MTSTWLNEHLATLGSVVVLFGCFLAGMLLSTEYAIVRYMKYSAYGLCTTGRQLGCPSRGWYVKRTRKRLNIDHPSVVPICRLR